MMKVILAFISLIMFTACTGNTSESGIPTVSVSIEAVGEPARQQAALVEERFVNMLSQHLGDAFRIIKGIGGGTSIHGTIARHHRDPQQLQVDLVLESRGARETIRQIYTLDRQNMQQLVALVSDKLTHMSTTTHTPRPIVRTRRRPIVILSNRPAVLHVYAEDRTLESKQLPGSDLAVTISLDGTRGYRFVAAPMDSNRYHRWESESSHYWPPEDTLKIRF